MADLHKPVSTPVSDEEMRAAIVNFVRQSELQSAEEGRRHNRIHSWNKVGVAGAIVSALATATALVVGSNALSLNAQALKQTVLQTEYSRRALMEVQRAFVTRLRTDMRMAGDHVAINPRWINNGTTGTKNGVNQTLCGEPDSFKLNRNPMVPMNLGPKEEREGPDCDIKNWFAKEKTDRDWKLILIFRIKYDDVFSHHHITSQCGVLNVPANSPLIQDTDAQECGGDLEKYNCIDDDCKGDASWQ